MPFPPAKHLPRAHHTYNYYSINISSPNLALPNLLRTEFAKLYSHQTFLLYSSTEHWYKKTLTDCSEFLKFYNLSAKYFNHFFISLVQSNHQSFVHPYMNSPKIFPTNILKVKYTYVYGIHSMLVLYKLAAFKNTNLLHSYCSW